MSTSALDPYLEAVRDSDAVKLSAALADDIVMHGPLISDPIEGRDQVSPILGSAFTVVDEFELGEPVGGPHFFAIPFTGRIEAEQLDGLEYVRLDEAGKIDSFTAFIRPLAAVVAFQNRLAPLLGEPVLHLIPERT